MRINLEVVDALGPKYGSSKQTRHRRQKKRPLKGGKRGNRGLFHGARDTFLAEHLPNFVKLKGAARKAQNEFWRTLFQEYWDKWPWYVPLDKEPGDAEWPQPDTTLEAVMAEKGKIIKQTQKQIRTHMRYQRTVILAEHRNPWAPLLQDLEDHTSVLPGPRKLAAWQLYMSKKPEEIASEFEAKWPTADLPEKHALAFRAKISRDLLAQESEEYRQALEEELQEIHASEAAEVEAATALATAAPEGEARELAQDNAAAMIQPLLQLLRDHTGYYLTLFAGIPLTTGEEEFKLKIAGKTAGPSPVPWQAHEPATFKNDIVKSFTRFLMKTPEWAERKARANGTYTPPVPASTSTTPLAAPQPAALETSGVDPAQGKAPGSSKHSKRVLNAKRRPRGKGKQRARSTSEEASESGSSEEDEDENDDDDDDDEDEDDEDEDEDEEDGEGNHTSLHGLDPVPRGAVVPTAVELGFGKTIQEELARQPAAERQAHLYRFSQMTNYEHVCINGRAEAAALMNHIQPTPIPLWLFPIHETPAKEARRKRPSKQQGSTAPATRKCGRLAERVTVTGSGSASASSSASPAVPPSASSTAPAAPPSASPAVSPSASPAASPSVPPAASSCRTVPPAAPFSTSPAATTATPTSPGMAALVTLTSLANAALAAVPVTNPPPATDTGAPVLDIQSTEGVDAAPAAPAAAPSLPQPAASLATPMGVVDMPAPTSGTSTVIPASTAVSNPSLSVPTQVNVPPGADIPVMLDEEGWPAWLRGPFDYMESQRLSKEFTQALEWWTVLERAYGFDTSSKGLKTTDRPPEIHHWLRVHRRVIEKPPTIIDENAYCRAWWLWWAKLQPGWRGLDDRGRPVIGGEGDWSALTQPGKNETLEDWHAAVKDVAYVVVAMAKVALEEQREEQGTKKRASTEDSDPPSQPPSKRLRT
ncbi:hypothetical protein ACG7TL_006356 [Trametes sanguinea]